MDFPAVRIGIEKILTDDNIDTSFSKTLTSELAKATHSNDRLNAFLNTGKVYNATYTKICGKKDESNNATAMNANANGDPNKTCQNRRCNRKGFANHLAKDCKKSSYGSNASSGTFTNLKRKAYQKDPEG